MFQPNSGEVKIFSGTSNPNLVKNICERLDLPVGKITIKKFKDEEIIATYDENIRDTDCFLIQSTCKPVNSHLMELLIMIDAAKRSSAARVTTVIPYYGYARQDRKNKPRVPITAKLVANLLESAGADRVLTLDLHSGQIQGFFDIPLDNLYASKNLVQEIAKLKARNNLIVVSPDVGGVKRTRAAAKLLDLPLAIIDKRRGDANQSEVMHIIGDVKGKNALLFDDMIDTAGTICNAADALKAEGAKEIYGMATHPVLSGDAIDKINKSAFKKVYVTDTIPLNARKKSKKIQVVPIGDLIGDAIRRIHDGHSISSLFPQTEDLA